MYAMYAREFERRKKFVRTFPVVFLCKIGLTRRNTIIHFFVYLFAFAILTVNFTKGTSVIKESPNSLEMNKDIR